MKPTTRLETYRAINREMAACRFSSRSNAWSSAVQNAADTLTENNLGEILGNYDIVVGEYDDKHELAMSAVAISSMAGILCSADEWDLTKRDVTWFASRGVEA